MLKNRNRLAFAALLLIFAWCDLFAQGDRSVSGITAPSAGLCLMKVWYDMNLNEMKDYFERRENP